MFLIRSAVLVLASALAPAAWAESNTLTGRPGFFKPTPDGSTSISQTLPETIPDVAAKTVPDAVAKKTVPDAVATARRDARREAARPRRPNDFTAIDDPVERARLAREAESALDRAEIEHERMKARSVSASSIPGAITGSATERDR